MGLRRHSILARMTIHANHLQSSGVTPSRYGAYVRAPTSDGRELWRRKFGGTLTRIAPGLEGKKEPQPAEHISLSTRSLCDEISSGMTKDGVSRLSQDRNLRIGEKERQSNSWVFEEPNFRCTILFGEAGTVVKNKKVIITN